MLLGGAVALLPAYAQDILHTGPWGLGLLRSAPAVGAGTMAILLAYRPLRRRVGGTMLWCVAAFGIFTIVFGISRSLTVSLVALALTGAADMVSVVIRVTLVQVPEVDVRKVRLKMGLSQAQFATRFGLPTATLRNWEQGRARPDAPTRVLLAVIAKHPKAVEDVLQKVGY